MVVPLMLSKAELFLSGNACIFPEQETNKMIVNRSDKNNIVFFINAH